MRGFLGGLIVGGIAFVAVAASVSLMKPLMQRPEVATNAPGTGAATPDDSRETGVGRAGRDADLVEAAPVVPDPNAAGPITSQPLDETATRPAGKPSVGGATGDLSGPSETPAAPGVSVQTDVPVAPAEVGSAPVQPESDSEPRQVADQPVQPEAPKVSDSGAGFGDSQTGTEQAPAVSSGADTAVQVSNSGPSTSEPGSESAPHASTAPAAVPTVTTQPEAAESPAPATGTTVPRGSGPAPAPQVVMPIQPMPAPDAGTVPPADEMPAPRGVRIAELPHAGTSGGEQHTVPGTPAKSLIEVTKPAPEAAAAPAVPPIEAYAAPFENPEDKPLMAIVLIDDAQAIGAEALSEFPYPITFAVDPDDPKAAEKMARHRADGFEVVVLADLARDATPKDAETSLQVWLTQVPESVAVLEGTRTGVQGNRALSDQVAENMRRSGHGLILQNNGLNTAQKLAAKAGVPSAVVFRDFDGAGQTPTVMRRFLDQAAFRARQEGAVIMLGRVRPDTISALLLWGLQDRATRVALAPVSAVLKAGAK